MIALTQNITNKINNEKYYTEADFIKDVKTYIKAVKNGRMLYTVTHVSNSGMSRDINIKSFEGSMSKGFYRNYFGMLNVMGYKFSNSHDVKVGGCGMNMLFSTNYNLIHAFKNMNFISKKECEVLAQKIN